MLESGTAGYGNAVGNAAGNDMALLPPRTPRKAMIHRRRSYGRRSMSATTVVRSWSAAGRV